MKQRALFLDRDGTLVHPEHYPSRPEQLRLYEGLGEPLRALQKRGFLPVVITNQAGLALGYFTAAELEHMHRFLRATATAGSRTCWHLSLSSPPGGEDCRTHYGVRMS